MHREKNFSGFETNLDLRIEKLMKITEKNSYFQSSMKDTQHGKMESVNREDIRDARKSNTTLESTSRLSGL